MKPWIPAVLLVPALLGGCVSGGYCLGEHKYQQAESLPPLKGVDGVQPPDSATALRIPPPPTQAVPYGQVYQDAEGDEKVRCLDKPPAMPPIEAKPPEPVPAAPAPDAEPPQPE